MTGPSIPRWALAAGLGGLIMAAAVRLWPEAETAPAPPPPAREYSGPILQPARSGVTPAPWLRLARLDDMDAAPAPEAAAPRLVGVIATGRPMAYLRSTMSGTVARVPVGGELDGWRLRAVTANTAVLERDGRRTDAGMFGAGASSSPQ